MTSLLKIAVNNRLLAALPAAARHALLQHGELVELNRGELLHSANEPIRSVYFPTGGLVSCLVSNARNAGFEIAAVGKEGMVGTTALLGAPSPFLAQAYLPGNALRVPMPVLGREMASNSWLHEELHRYLLVSIRNLGQRIFCMNYHSIEERLARWLLVAHDTSVFPLIPITHHFLSNLLGARRGSITHAANALQRQKFIWYHRGNILVLNKAGLESIACSCYHQEKETYESFMNKESVAN